MNTRKRAGEIKSLPNFFVIGAGKSGTTTLNHMLSSHPQIFMSPLKEPCFFCWDEMNSTLNRSAIKELDQYMKLFKGSSGHIAIGEVSPQYLTKQSAPYRIHSLVPSAKIIVILRNPVDRAYSLYMHFRRDGFERDPDFLNAIEKSKYRQHYIADGEYSIGLSKYFDLFGEDKICVILYEDFFSNTDMQLRKIFKFLNLSEYSEINTEVQRNVSGLPQSRVMKVLITTLSVPSIRAAARKVLPNALRERALYILHEWMKKDLKKIPMTPDQRSKMVDIFSAEIDALGFMIKRDLADWKKL